MGFFIWLPFFGERGYFIIRVGSYLEKVGWILSVNVRKELDGGIVPQRLKAVEFPHIGEEDMDHDMTVVDYYPLAVAVALIVDRLHAAVFKDPFLTLSAMAET